MQDLELKELGLTDYEARAFQSLVKLGKSSASLISKDSEVPYGKIYEVLSSLEQKGFVQIVPEKTKKFVASDPEILQKIVDKKEQKLRKIRQRIKQLKKLYELQNKENVVIAQGKRNWYKILREQKPPQTFNYSIKWTSEFYHDYIREYKESKKKGVDIKILTRYDQDNKVDIQKWLSIGTEMHEFPNKGVAFSIQDDSVVIALIKSNTIILIRDEAFIDIMKRMVDIVYAHTVKIEKE